VKNILIIQITNLVRTALRALISLSLAGTANTAAIIGQGCNKLGCLDKTE